MTASQKRENNRMKDLQNINFVNGFAKVSHEDIRSLMDLNDIYYHGAIDLENQLELGTIYGIAINYNINTQNFDVNII